MLSSEPVDLSNCDREPIHIPGSIQPHGVLMVLSEPDLKIVQISSNSTELLGCAPEQLLNQPVSNLISAERIQAIAGCLAEEFDRVNPLKLEIEVERERRLFDGIIHRHAGALILELESTQTSANASFFGFYGAVKGTLAKLQTTHTSREICELMVTQVRQLTGFDRVTIYQFDAEGAGRVVAEDKRAALTPYLGLHYPASDIPLPAKQLYALNSSRSIPNTNYRAASLVPLLDPRTNTPTDLSFAVLRSVSPMHIEYLHNMGVGASMSISLKKHDRLWGLIACHHDTPKYLNYELRTACEFLGQVMSLELAAKEENEDLDYQMKLKGIQSSFVEFMPQQQSLLDALLADESKLLELVDAAGAVVCQEDRLYRLGSTPDLESIPELLSWIETQLDGNVYSTDTLASFYPPAAAYSSIASGILALAISPVNRTYIVWFRPEVVTTINWGGNPHKPVEVSTDGSVRLSPRKSFALWQETVRDRSRPWKACEIDAALELRSTLVGIVLRQADELAKINIELERSNQELDSFAYIASHDLKEPLRGIHNYSTFLIEDYGEVLDEEGVAKLQTLVKLTQRMEDLINSILHFSRLGRIELTRSRTDLNEVLRGVLDVLRLSFDFSRIEIAIPRPLPTAICDRVQMGEVFTNLISNAIKYNERDRPRIEIGYLDRQDYHEDESMLALYIRDNGIGISPQHQEKIFRIFKRLHARDKYGGGTGAGLTIAKKIVERHGGKIWLESIAGEGSTFYFTVPE